MFTFLSRAYKTEVQREYRKRLLAVVSGLACALAFLAAALSLPSFVVLSIKKSNASSVIASNVPSEDGVDYESRARAVRDEAAALNRALDGKALMPVVERIAVRSAQGGISLTGMSLRRGGDQANPAASVAISGMAATREALVAFSKALQNEPSFRNVDLPVSALAKSRDVGFSISFEARL